MMDRYSKSVHRMADYRFYREVMGKSREEARRRVILLHAENALQAWVNGAWDGKL